jgi:HPt (histidine-containing phosphotransfer) domain-containing protein
MEGRIDRSFLAELTEGDEQFMLELLTDFVEQAAVLRAEALVAVEQKDAEGLHRATHALKGSSASVGARGLSEAAKAVDDYARAGNLVGAIQRIPALWEELDAVCREVEEWSRRAA